MHFYAISRRDLPAHQQAIQAAHAQHEYCRLFPGTVASEEHPAFVWLTVEDKRELFTLHAILQLHGVRVVEFHDPDYEGYDPSAIACLLNQDQRYLLSEYPLWKCSPYRKKGFWSFFRKD